MTTTNPPATPKSSASCPCGAKAKYGDCCGPFIAGESHAPTAEKLMRARYTAFATGAIDYIEKTHDPKRNREFDRANAESWSSSSEWKGLEIVSKEAGEKGDPSGEVEFIARFRIPAEASANGKAQDLEHRERAIFRFDSEQWFFVDGKSGAKPFVRAEPKLGRNDPCSCGSGKKFKKCCGANS